MKKILFFAFLLVQITCFAQRKVKSPVSCFAQRKVKSPVSFGIKAGLNVANLKDEQDANTDAIIGVHLGVLAHIHLTPKIAVQPEVTYSLQGAKYPNLGTEKLGYVNIPVLLQYMFQGGFRLETGPQLGFVTNAKLDRNSGGETNIKDQLETVDLSWAFGLGYLSDIGLGVDGRFNLGLTNIAEETTVPHVVKNRVWQVGLFYQFMR
jgi:hypothetical protein